MENLNDVYISNIVTYVGYFLKNGIIIDGKKMSFSILDYYSVIHENIDDIAKKAREIKKYMLYRNFFLQFANNNGYFFHTIEDAKEVVNEHHIFIKGDLRFVPTEEDVQNILDLLDSYNIPRYTRVVYIALRRQAFGYPILPLASCKEEEKSMAK